MTQQKNPDPMAQLAARIRALETGLADVARRPAYIPVLDEDPPEDSPHVVWLMQDGRLRARYRDTDGVTLTIREFEPVPTPGSGSSGEPTPDPEPITVTKQLTYGSTWSATYRGNGALRTDKPGLIGHGSSGDSFGGKMSGLIGFNSAAIAADLAGATVNAAWIVLSNDRTWYNDGGTLMFGGHGFGSAPGSWNGTGLPVNMAGTNHIGKGQQNATLGIPVSIAAGIRDGSVHGVALQAPDSGRQWYGYEKAHGAPGAPQLIINFTGPA